MIFDVGVEDILRPLSIATWYVDQYIISSRQTQKKHKLMDQGTESCTRNTILKQSKLNDMSIYLPCYIVFKYGNCNLISEFYCCIILKVVLVYGLENKCITL